MEEINKANSMHKHKHTHFKAEIKHICMYKSTKWKKILNIQTIWGIENVKYFGSDFIFLYKNKWSDENKRFKCDACVS